MMLFLVGDNILAKMYFGINFRLSFLITFNGKNQLQEIEPVIHPSIRSSQISWLNSRSYNIYTETFISMVNTTAAGGGAAAATWVWVRTNGTVQYNSIERHLLKLHALKNDTNAYYAK